MRKALLIGLIVCVLALGGIGAAFATGMNFSGVHALSVGKGPVPQINVDYASFHLSSAYTLPVTVDGVYISFDKDITDAAVSVTVRDVNGAELAYCAINNYSQAEGDIKCFHLMVDSGSLPTADKIYYVGACVGEKSVWNAAPSGGWVFGPGDPSAP